MEVLRLVGLTDDSSSDVRKVPIKSKKSGLSKQDIEKNLKRAKEIIYEGDYELVIQLCDDVLSAEEGNPVAWFWKGKALTALARDKEAFQCYMKAKTMPNPLLIMNNMTISQGILDSEEGRIKMRKMKFPEDKGPLIAVANGWSQRGAYSQTMGQFEAALYCYERALKIDPNYKPAMRNKERVITLLKNEGLL